LAARDVRFPQSVSQSALERWQWLWC